MFRSNTNTILNMRLPITAKTHDNESCQLAGCIEKSDVRKLTAIVSRVVRQETGYFTGYMSKRQPVGKYEFENCLEPNRYLTVRQ